ncbi:MAG: alpha/beta hydrolase [Spartobacteria bacterium]|nr:alpha/beta hydrolase [Spartobacteria bacterium]
MDTKIQTLKDGRKLAYIEYGAPQGVPVFYAHGGPGSRLEGVFFHEAATQYGFRFIATDRPGMGDSTFLKNQRLLDYPSDICELANALGVDRFGVMGWSGGGAHTTVCSYAIPERLLFNITFAGYTNFAELPDAAKYLKTKMDQISVGLSQTHPKLFKLFFDMMGFSEKHMPKAYFDALMKDLTDSDREIARQEHFHDLFMLDQAEAFKQGANGVTVDAAVHYVDWGFKLKDITFPIHVFHGTKDTMVPFAYGEHLAENVPHCTLHPIQGEGHLFPYKHVEEIFEFAEKEINS